MMLLHHELKIACQASTRLHEFQVRLRDVVSYVAETIGQIVAAECTSKCMDSINYSQIETRIEHQAASICEQRRAMSHADLQALLKPTREAIIVETTPKVPDSTKCWSALLMEAIIKL